MLTPEQERSAIETWERVGQTQVRSDMDHGRMPPSLVNLASRWLADKEREAEAKKDASTAAQIAEARRASSAAERQATAAERANTRATIALIIAIISMIISAVAIAVTHWDAHK